MQAADSAYAQLTNAAKVMPLAEPMLPAVLRARSELRHDKSCSDLFDYWASRSVGNPLSSDRYRWELTHRRGTGIPAYAGDPKSWQAWRPSEQPVLDKNVFAFEENLMAPIICCESAELLLESAATDRRCEQMLIEAEPVLRRDFAAYALERNAWIDTFGLYCLVRYPKLFERLQPIAIAASEAYVLAARRNDGIVFGTRYPLHERPLISATAQLASALLVLGQHLDLVAKAASFIVNERRPDGGFGDPEDPSDVLTTLVAAEFVASVDPAFSLQATVEFLVRAQDRSGFWKALGPEVPWLTLQIARLLRASEQPFATRFRFPHVAAVHRDRKTQLPFFAHFVDLAMLFSTLPSLAQSELDIAFIDLIGFREFNNRKGQALGDAVLAAFAEQVAWLEHARAIRDGGDEFLVISAPGSTELESRLLELQRSWPAVFRAKFGADAPLVLSRIIHARAQAKHVSAVREALGTAIGALKGRSVDPLTGIFSRIELNLSAD